MPDDTLTSLSCPLYYVRHGQTEWNRDGRLQGRQDSALTQLGRSQAEQQGRILARLLEAPTEFQFIASPLGRTRETARIVTATLGVAFDTVRLDERLVELSFGSWEGATEQDVEAHSPGQWAAREAQMWSHRAPSGGESYSDAAERAALWLAEWRTAPRPTVIISHGGLGRVFRGHYAGLSPAEALALDFPQGVVHLLQNGVLTDFAA